MSYHVFRFPSSADKPVVEKVVRRLKKEAIEACLDKSLLIPGDPWQPTTEKALAEYETRVVYVGPSRRGPWQNEEVRAAIDQRAIRSMIRMHFIDWLAGIRGVEPGLGPGQAIREGQCPLRAARFRYGRGSLFLRGRSSGA